MDLDLGEKYEQLRRETLAFVADNWPLRGGEAELPQEQQETLFRKRGIEAGFLFRTVPREYGGPGLEADVLAETVIREALNESGAPWRMPNPQGTDMLVPTLLEEGSPEQCQKYIPPTLFGELRWCQGYSEPGSGSDLASLQSRAELDGDEWVLSGQKIWTSNALEADMMFGLFRTEPDAPRHGGISYLLVDMKSPGIDARPLKQMNGGSEFCEVFFDNVRVPAENIVGARGEGWKVSKATLKHERMLIGDANYLKMVFDDLLALARKSMRGGRPAIEDPAIRQQLASIEGFVATQKYASFRMISAISRNEDMKAINEMMMTKLYLTNVAQKVAKLSIDLVGDGALLAPADDETTMRQGWKTVGSWVSNYMMTLGIAIAGGASNIQRNLIGERILGLPRDLRRSTN
ncbi:MAG: acyl-CoA dehydrogenase family protein [Myxococcota bacterium]